MEPCPRTGLSNLWPVCSFLRLAKQIGNNKKKIGSGKKKYPSLPHKPIYPIILFNPRS